VYLSLVEARGRVPLVLRLVDLADSRTICQWPFCVACPDPLIQIECCARLPALPPIGLGNYSIDLLHDGEILGSCRLRILPPA
jgi:hypothetical protein